MVDIDSRFNYSKVIKVNGCKNKSNVIIYPNPTAENVTVSGIKPGNMIQVISSIGQTLSSFTATLPNEVINTGNLSKGVYIISIIDKTTGEKENYKITKQ
jgi:hypothetical protein